MSNQLIIDAAHPEEVRIAIIKQGQVEDFDFEAQTQRSPIGNIYLGKVTRVEPALQACFVDYGDSRQGFLPFNDIHPDYFNIPKADKDALLVETQSQNKNGDAETSAPLMPLPGPVTKQEPSPDATDDSNGDALADIQGLEDTRFTASTNTINGAQDDAHEAMDSEDQDEATRSIMRQKMTRRYKIQEVIKRDQVILVQIAKETRNTKGAALTTYLSLAGRYCVLMPNAYKPRGGMISRKVPQGKLRTELRHIVSDLQIPPQMELILRTSSAGRPAQEVMADHDYLQKLWGEIRARTLKARAPSLVHEENTLIGRAIRDLFKNDIDEILIEGAAGYEQAKSFMTTLMPNQLNVLKKFEGAEPIFQTLGVEAHLESLFQPSVALKSGGYLVINQTEALVAVDVNSGKATRAHSIEKTALNTNMEAAEEIARQARLRDLSGLIVIDFIDMMERQNNRMVETCLKRAIRKDRARIQLGRISSFGLLEMSRQRMRSDIYASRNIPCPHCEGSGKMRSVETRSLFVLRQLQAYAKPANSDTNIQLFVPKDIADYLQNQKQQQLDAISGANHVHIIIAPLYTALQYAITTDTTQTPPAPLNMDTTPAVSFSPPGSTQPRHRHRRGGRRRSRGGAKAHTNRHMRQSEHRRQQSADEATKATRAKKSKSFWGRLFGASN